MKWEGWREDRSIGRKEFTRREEGGEECVKREGWREECVKRGVEGGVCEEGGGGRSV